MALRHFLAIIALLATTACGMADGRHGLYASFRALTGDDEPVKATPSVPCYLSTDPAQARWADSVLASLSLHDRVGQLFMVQAYSNRGPEHLAALEKLVTEQKVGGLIFMQGGPVRQLRMTNRLQSAATLPLMIAIDGEWGLQMRLQDSTIGFPKQMTLGAHPDEALIVKMGREIARQCRRMGIHVNFAPDIDINSNPANPVIGMRSFGENKENVALKGAAYARGMQRGGVLACAKHFPGHGDTDVDSHFGLPHISHTRKRIEEMELYPFRRLMADSVASVMVAHLQIPSLDKSGKPSTLSRPIITDLLRKQMGFGGLVFTDALNMKGAAKFAPPGELEVAAIQAGNDVLLIPEDAPKAIDAIVAAVEAKKLDEAEINEHVRRILLAKWWLGLTQKPAPLAESGVYQDLVNPRVQALVNECYRAAITVVRDQRKLLPLRNLDTMDFASIAVGEAAPNAFQKQLGKYAAFQHYSLGSLAHRAEMDALEAKLKSPDGKRKTIVVGLHKITSKDKSTYGLQPDLIPWLQHLSQHHHVIVVAFGNPYALKLMTGIPELVCAFENESPALSAAAQALFGAGATGGRLPVSLSLQLPEGSLQFRPDIRRLGFGEPEEAGMDSRKLARLDTLARSICASGITPGCQMVVTRRGKVVYQRSFGTLTYAPKGDSLTRRAPVTDSTIYDIASITKVAGTLQAVMFLQERGLIDLTHRIGEYLPELAGSNKDSLILADILTHQAGLAPTLPLWEKTQVKGTVGYIVGPPTASELPEMTVSTLPPAEPLPGTRLSDVFYCSGSDSGWFDRTVAPGLYAMRTIEDSLWKWTVRSSLLPRNKRGGHDYLYSDVGFYLLKRLSERMLNQPINEFLAQNFYAPLGLQTMGYRPLERFDTSRIAPTEDDRSFRRRLIRGTVHDPGAAMLGGVGGHAGLFCNALDLAILMQMNLQNGQYGGTQFLLPQTVPYFTDRHFPRNRRGFGWDKPVPSGGGPTSKYASARTFGHTGFTGTCVWADPKEDLVFVFLSNRVYPDAENKRLINENIRPRLQDIVYQAITDSNLVAQQ